MQHSWELRPNRYHSQYLWLPPYYIDLALVTQDDFSAYLKKEGAKAVSTDRYHYLMNWDWSDSAMPKPWPGNDTLPATYIGYAEATAVSANNT